MAILKQRLHKRSESGGYDTIYLETSADVVKMADGTSVEMAVSNKAAENHTHSGYAEVSHKHSAADITSGVLSATKGGTGTTSQDAALSSMYSHCAVITQTDLSAGCTVPLNNGGSPKQISLTNFKRYINTPDGGPTTAAPAYPSSIPAVGSTFSWVGKTWLVVHKLTGVAFACLKDMTETAVWDTKPSGTSGSTDYIGSAIHAKCMEFAAANNILAANYVIPMNGGPVWLASYCQVNGGFSHFSSDNNRIARMDGNITWWWTSSPHSVGNVWCIDNNGRTSNSGYSTTLFGFRPFVALKL